MPLKIIGAGFGRTGTFSTKIALDELGFKCYHMSEVIKGGGSSMRRWIEAANDPSSADWETIFDGYDATVDWPGTYFWESLIEYYPNAKVILNVRDAEKWYESVHNTLYKNGSHWTIKVGTKLIPRMWNMGEMVMKIIWFGTFDNRFLDKPYTIEKFNNHNNKVKHNVSKDRLLVFDVKQGWKPLCEFLNVPIPDKPFPSANDGKSINRKFAAFKQMVYIFLASLIGIFGIILYKYFL